MYAGKKSGFNGVGFLVKKCMKDNIQNFIAISDRVARLDLKFGQKILNIIQVYAPTTRGSEDQIESFYKDILSSLKDTTEHTLIIGDFNAKVGLRKNDENKVLGAWGYGVRNFRGETLIQFCLENEFKICNTFFKKRPKMKWTWRSPNGEIYNEIDFILAKKKNSSVENVQVINTSYPSDHRLLRVSYNLGVKKQKSRKNYGKIAKDLNPPEKELLQNAFTRLYQPSNTDNVQQEYINITQTIKKSINELPSRKENQAETNYITEDIRKLINERKALKDKQTKSRQEKKQLSVLYRKIKKKINKNKYKHHLKVIHEELKLKGSVKRAEKQLRQSQQWITKLQDHVGCAQTKRESLIEIATSFYENLYDSDRKGEKHLLKKNEEIDEVPPFMDSEILNILTNLKCDKSPGEDRITNDALKALSGPLTPVLTKLFNNILTLNVLPQEWETSIITLLYKKGSCLDIGNYRPISLLQTIYKVFTSALLQRLRPILEKQQPKEQAGFRPGFSTMDHVFTLTQVIERYMEYQKEIYIAFIDYKKAFDSINHHSLWRALNQQGVPRTYIQILQEIYCKSKGKVKLDRVGDSFFIKRGVRQGDPVSPNLFTALLETIFRNINIDGKGLNINGENLNHLRFADDIVLIAERHEDLSYMLTVLDEKSRDCGLEMNQNKTCLMTNGQQILTTIRGQEIKYVNEYTYLGQNICFANQTLNEVERRIKKAWSKYWSLKHVFKAKLPLTLKKKAMDSCVLPTLLYGCQTWVLSRAIIKKLQVTQRAMERSMLNIKLRDRHRNTSIRQRTKIIDAARQACQLKWRWAGHAARCSDGRWTERIIHWYPRGADRPRGRPRRRWRDDIEEVAGSTWTRSAADRTLWRQMEEAYTRKWVSH